MMTSRQWWNHEQPLAVGLGRGSQIILPCMSLSHQISTTQMGDGADEV